MKPPIEVKEYESIICKKEYADVDSFRCIEKKAFEELVTFIQEYTGDDKNSDALEFMRVCINPKVHDYAVTFKNYVGLIQMKNGFQVQVLPKVDFVEEDDHGNEATKKLFLNMLRCLKDFPSKVFNDASLKVDHMNLYELFINMYVQEVRQLVKHGLRSAYVEQQENLKCYKGKLLIGPHIKANIAHKERFYVAYDEFHLNRPENRLIKATLEKLQRLTTSAENSKEIRQLLVSFEMVETSKNYEKDFAKVVINRSTKDYENLMKWSRVFLMNESFTTFSGSTTSRALLFPMESVYESYVAKKMKKVFGPNGWNVSSQDKGHYLFVEPKNQFALRPDIVLTRGEQVIVMDTKWKKLIPSVKANYGISQSDMYQMYAYSKKYKHKGSDICPDVWLLYPLNRDMRSHAPIEFDSGDNTKVRIHFVDLEHVEENLKELMDKIETRVTKA